MLTGWLTPLVQSIYGAMFDRISRRHASSRFSDLLETRDSRREDRRNDMGNDMGNGNVIAPSFEQFKVE